LQKIGLKASKWQIKKSPTPTRRNENVDKNDLGCSPLVYANLQSGEIEEHVLPDSFDDENFFDSTNVNDAAANDDASAEMKVDINAIRRKFENTGIGNGNDANGGNDVTNRCSSSSLSPSSRKSMLNPGSSYRSSTTSAVSANSASANSVAASEDSGIVVTQPRSSSSTSGKPGAPEIEVSPSSPTFFNNNNNETKLKNVTTSDYVIKPHLGKIDESPAASSRCSSSNGLGVKTTESVRNKSRPGAPVRRRDSSQKAWYDVPSDEDHEAPEADSLASIISNRSSSEEDF
jgi:hypothetical protein